METFIVSKVSIVYICQKFKESVGRKNTEYGYRDVPEFWF